MIEVTKRMTVTYEAIQQLQINVLRTMLDSGSISENTCTVAHVALIISIICLIWNVVSLIIGLIKMKKVA